MDLLIDTQAIVWFAIDPQRLGAGVHTALRDENARFYVSAITAWEYSDLNRRRRFGIDLPLRPVLERLRAPVIDYPADTWLLADDLPDLHRDPVDRMLVAHAIRSAMTLISADATLRRYPVPIVW